MLKGYVFVLGGKGLVKEEDLNLKVTTNLIEKMNSKYINAKINEFITDCEVFKEEFLSLRTEDLNCEKSKKLHSVCEFENILHLTNEEIVSNFGLESESEIAPLLKGFHETVFGKEVKIISIDILITNLIEKKIVKETTDSEIVFNFPFGNQLMILTKCDFKDLLENNKDVLDYYLKLLN